MPDLLDGHPIPVLEQLGDAVRELHLRRTVYPRLVARGRMSERTAARQIRVQEAIVRTLQILAERGIGSV